MEIIHLTGRKQARDARRRFLAEVQGGGMEYPALWKWILTVDESGGETVPSSIGMAWIRENPVAFARVVGNVSWFLRASMIECERGCIPDLAVWLFPDVLTSVEILSLIPAEAEQNEREELICRLYARYGATNSSWSYVAAGLGVSGETIGRALIERLVVEAAGDPSVRGAADDLLDERSVARVNLWKVLPQDRLTAALTVAARTRPGDVLTVLVCRDRGHWRFQARDDVRGIAAEALRYLEEVPMDDAALGLFSTEQKVDLASRLKPVRADSPKLGAATARFLADLAGRFQPESQYGVWLRWSPVLDAVDPIVVYRAVREVVRAGDQIARHVRDRLKSAGYEVGVVEMIDFQGKPLAGVRRGDLLCYVSAPVAPDAPVLRSGDEVAFRPVEGRLVGSGVSMLRFTPIVVS